MHQIEKDLREAAAEWNGTGKTRNWKISDLPALMEQAATHIAGQATENINLEKRVTSTKVCTCP